jgi:predicted RNase H-like HicB family nuclease
MSDYVVIYEQAEDGAWGAYLPDLPGVVALGATRSEVGERIEEALVAYADDVRGRGGVYWTATTPKADAERARP